MRLYWLADVHGGATFVIAGTAEEARAFYETSESMLPGDATVEPVLDVPAWFMEAAVAKLEVWCRDQGFPAGDPSAGLWPCWAFDVDLVHLGASVKWHAIGVREVVIAGRRFFPTPVSDLPMDRPPRATRWN